MGIFIILMATENNDHLLHNKWLSLATHTHDATVHIKLSLHIKRMGMFWI